LKYRQGRKCGNYGIHLKATEEWIRHLIDHATANTISCSIVIIRLDYCNAVLYGITGKTFYDCNVSRTHWLQLSVWHHFVVLQLRYSAPYTGFQSDTGSHTKLLH